MLMEVLVTIAIVGMTLVPLFMTQSNALRGVYRYAQRLRLIVPAKNFFVDIFSKKKEQSDDGEKKEVEIEEKEITDPAAKLTHKKRKLTENSAFKKIKDLEVHEVIVRGTRGGRESIIGWVYKPERKKKAEEEKR